MFSVGAGTSDDLASVGRWGGWMSRPSVEMVFKYVFKNRRIILYKEDESTR
jgi:hypothetical protein